MREFLIAASVVAAFAVLVLATIWLWQSRLGSIVERRRVDREQHRL